LLTLTGAGGSGKTRLALEAVTRELAESGVAGAWVELAPISNPALLGEAVLSALGVRDESNTPPLDRLVSIIGGRPFLLVLDNGEHLAEACATLADALLRRAPELRILVTSRAALGVAGETAWLVPPLSLPATDGQAADDSEAVQLFVQRAQAVSPSFCLTSANRAAVVQICRRLDGLPLALELAAARLRVLSPGQIAARLDDRFRLLTTGNRTALPRHQTLRAAIDWSYGLLDERERQLLARLAVFRGSFALEAAEAVCAGGGLAASDVLDVLSALLDKSLVEMVESGGNARYRLLETVREYAAERLDTASETAPRSREHARFFAALAREAEPHLRTPHRPAWLARLLPEMENLRQALEWSRVHDAPMHVRFVGSLHWFWFSTGQWPEARQWLRGALALPEAQAPTSERASLLFSSGSIGALQARADEARAQLAEAELIAERGDDRRLLADIRNYLAMALNQAADPSAEEVILRSRSWLRESNDLYALRLNFLLEGVAHALKGDLERAVQVTEEGVRVARVFGLSRELAIALSQLATIVARAGDWPRVRALLSEALTEMRADPMLLFVSRALELMGSSASAAGDSAEAARLYGAAQAIRDSIGAEMWGVDREQHRPFVDAARASLGAKRFEREHASGRAMGMDEAIDYAIAVGERLGQREGADPTSHTAEYEAVRREPRVPVPAPVAHPSLKVRSLGPLEVSVEGTPTSSKRWGYAKARELLLYLVVHPEGRTREQAGAALWPEASSAQVRNNFHVAMHHLRRALGHADWVRYESDRYRLDVPGATDFDARIFEDTITAALRAGRRGAYPVDQVRDALTLYRGDFLDGESIEDWHLELRDRLARLHADALGSLGGALASAGRWQEAVEILESLVAREPLHERGYHDLMMARALAGDRDGAMRDYRRLVEVLRREGAAGPGREVADLHGRLQRGETLPS
jgi:non-specific serine/threonine protein kinase